MKILLAGAENDSHWKTLEAAKAPYVLTSWYRLRLNPKKAREKLLKIRRTSSEVLIDSGAHTLYNEYSHLDPRQAGKHAGVDKRFHKKKQIDSLPALIAELDAYVAEFTAWLADNRDCYTSFAELDLDSMVGLDTVLRWRQQMVDAGLRPMPTYHNTTGYHEAGGPKEFLRRAIEQNLDYVGLAREKDHTFHTAFFTDYRDLLVQHKIRVHLWGWTDTDAFRRIPAYSIDSTSWLNGAKYGTTHWWQPGESKIHLYDYRQKQAVRPQMEQFCKTHGIDFDAYMRDEEPAVKLFHAHVWVGFARWLAEHPIDPYWLSQEEQTKQTEQKREELGISRIQKRGAMTTVYTPLDDPRHSVGRFCNGCVVKDRCTHYQQDAECAFPALLHVDSKESFQNMVMMVLSMQAGRLSHMAMLERQIGGHADPAVTKEMKTFLELLKLVSEMGRPKDRITIQAEGANAPGVLARLLSKD